jgi:hypothetical protein
MFGSTKYRTNHENKTYTLLNIYKVFSMEPFSGDSKDEGDKGMHKWTYGLCTLIAI